MTGNGLTSAQPVTVEGLWWKQETNVTGFLGVSNLSNQARQISIQVTDRAANLIAEHSFTLGSDVTKLIALDELKAAPTSDGGILVSWTGAPEDLVLNGGLHDPATGYSANIPLAPPPSSNPAPISVHRYTELGLMTGAADPMMRFPASTIFAPYSVVRNLSNQPVQITPRIYWTQGGEPHTALLTQSTISPHQSANLDVPSLLATAGLRTFNGTINLILDVQGSPHALIMASGSVDAKNTYVFAVRSSAVSTSVAKSVSYWSTANGDDTMVTLWNPADEPQDLVFTVYFSGGYYLLPLHLEGRVTRSFNMSEIIANQVPDINGNVILPSVNEGSATISGIHDLNEQILVALDAGTFNPQKATCGAYCQTCHGAADYWINADPFSIQVGGATQETMTIQMDNGRQYDWTSTASWSSSDTSIATVSGGNVTGQSPGSVSILGQDDGLPLYSKFCDGFFHDCPANYGAGAQASGSVKPTVNIQVQSGFISMAGNGLVVLAGPGGSLTSTAITAVGNPGGGAVSWSAGPNLQISGINSANASVSGTAASGSGGDTYVDVTYTVNGQNGSASVRFTVLDPRTLQAANFPGGSSSTTPYNSGSNSGFITTITYFVYDQMSPANTIALPGMSFTEILSTNSNPYGGTFVPPDESPLTVYSDANGTVRDLLWVYGPGGIPAGFSASRSQTLTVNGFVFNPSQQQSYTSTYGTIANQTLTR